jgi:hypothetical protein
VRPEHLEPVPHRINVLRGEGVAARRARELTCRKGHPKVAENLYVSPDGDRECRICRDARLRAHYLARKEHV